MNRLLLLTLVVSVCVKVHGNTIPAASPSRVDVEAAIGLASDGDTVTIPSGTAHWVTNLLITKAIDIEGAGTNVTGTVILDDIPTSASGLANLSSLIWIQTVSNKSYTIGNIYFSNSPVRTFALGTSTVLVSGESRATRVHDCVFGNLTNRLRTIFYSDSVCGVVDHSQFYQTAGIAVTIEHQTWNGELGGFGAWDSDNTMGTTNVICIEDCYFRGPPAVTDSDNGGHYCLRHCIIDGGHPDSHEMGENYMAVRNVEIYNNIFTNQGGNVLMLSLRGGTAVCFSNQNVGAFNTSGSLVGLYAYRNIVGYPTWGRISGTNGWDNCSSSPVETGTVTATNNLSQLIDYTKTWTPNQYIGYVVQNLNQWNAESGSNATGHACGVVSANTTTTMTFYAYGVVGGDITFTNGGQYAVYYVTNSFNQPGVGKGDFISNPATSPHWLNEQIEPIYTWSNTPSSLVSFAQYANVRQGIHYFDNTPKPGYTSFVYPNPLVQPDTNHYVTITPISCLVNGSATAISVLSNSVVTVTSNFVNFDHYTSTTCTLSNSTASTTYLTASNNTIVIGFYSTPSVIPVFGRLMILTAPSNTLNMSWTNTYSVVPYNTLVASNGLCNLPTDFTNNCSGVGTASGVTYTFPTNTYGNSMQAMVFLIGCDIRLWTRPPYTPAQFYIDYPVFANPSSYCSVCTTETWTNSCTNIVCSANLIPLMTASNVPSGLVSASSYNTGVSSFPYYAFNTIPAQFWISQVENNSWLQYQFTTNVTINSFSGVSLKLSGPIIVSLTYSTNGSVWANAITWTQPSSSSLFTTNFPTITANYFRWNYSNTASFSEARGYELHLCQ